MVIPVDKDDTLPTQGIMVCALLKNVTGMSPCAEHYKPVWCPQCNEVGYIRLTFTGSWTQIDLELNRINQIEFRML